MYFCPWTCRTDRRENLHDLSRTWPWVHACTFGADIGLSLGCQCK